MKLILASQSPYRRKQLENFGLNFTAVAPEVNEDELKGRGPQDLTELTRYLSEHKARSLATRHPGDLILGSDQLVELEGHRLDKPGTMTLAEQQLAQMSGKEHRLITSLAMITANECLLFTDITTVRLKTLSAEMIKAYCQTDQPIDCAGSYKIERAGLSLIDALRTEDPSAIQGLPLMSLMRGLEQLKISIADFWETK